jgi:glycosyltransferase involved in cell wall biosynthesis
MMNDIFFSVIIPLYNKQNAIAKTLQSIVLQTYKNYEIIVIDDGSTDNSFSMAKQFFNANLNVESRIIYKENGGVCSARNVGVKEAKYNYIALLDADDLWERNYLEEQIKLVNDFPEAKMWGVNYAETYSGKIARDVPTGLPKSYRGYVDDYFRIKGRVSDLFHSSAVVIEKEVFEHVGYFDERIKYAEDNDMWFRIIATNKVAFYDKYLVKYVQDAENRAMNQKHELKYFLPFYVDKYKDEIFKSNSMFYRWINCWCAIHLRKYFFEEINGQREDAKVAVKKLDYSVIPKKYKYLFGLPYPFARLLNKLDVYYHKLCYSQS